MISVDSSVRLGLSLAPAGPCVSQGYWQVPDHVDATDRNGDLPPGGVAGVLIRELGVGG